MKVTTVRVEQPIAVLLRQIVEKRVNEAAPSKNNQSVTAEAIRALHKKEFK